VAVYKPQRRRGFAFAKVPTSPLQRASRTCQLAGFGEVCKVDRNPLERNYGEDEGRRRFTMSGLDGTCFGTAVPG
jgi:hypothetical protein